MKKILSLLLVFFMIAGIFSISTATFANLSQLNSRVTKAPPITAGASDFNILWDDGHNQYSGYKGGSVSDTWDLLKSFPNVVFTVNTDPFNNTMLADVDILIIPYIDLALTSAEKAALDTYIQNGGMVWWGGYYHMSFFNKTMNNEWISNYGIEFMLNTSTPASNYIEIHDATNNTGSTYYPIFWTFPNTHNLLFNITELSISSTTQVYVDPLSVNTTILATGDTYDTYFDGDGSSSNNFGDLNKTDVVPLAVYERGNGGALIVCGGSNFLYEYDLTVGKDQFWQNMYDYCVSARTGMSLTVAPSSINVNRTASVAFSFGVTVGAIGTKDLIDVKVNIDFATDLQLIGGAIPTVLGKIAAGGSDSVTYNFNVAADGDYLINITITATSLGESYDAYGQVSVHAYSSTPPWTPPTTTSTQPVIPGFPIIAIVMGVISALGFDIIHRRRKQRN